MISEPMLELHCRTLTAPGIYSTESYTARAWEDFADLSCSQENQKCILLRAVLVALQVVDLSCRK
jgi:flagellar biosynthesis regulator FlaF